MSTRQRLYENFSALFITDSGEEEQPDGETEQARKRRLAEEERERKQNQSTMWLDFAFVLASNDPLRVKDVLTNMGIQEAFVLRNLQMRAARKAAA